MASYVFIGNSVHLKSRVTMQRLYEVQFFTARNCVIITNSETGYLIDFAKSVGVRYIVARNNKEIFKVLKNMEIDYLISCGWHLKISESVLGLARKIAINSHSSYLPDYKGLGAYKHAWANAEDYTGNTVHIMNSKFDTGNILAQSKIKIFWWDTPRTLLYRISEHTPSLLMLAIERYNNGFVGIDEKLTNGRYFVKTSNAKFICYRLYNLFAKATNLRRKCTKYVIESKI